MAEDGILVEDAPPEPRGRPLAVRILRWLGVALLAVLVLLAIAIAWLHTKSGREFVVEQIAEVAPASGLKIEVGSIEGSVLWSATLHDVKFRDADNKLFLQVPDIDLNWRPLKFFITGLDVRSLALHKGTLFSIGSDDPSRRSHPPDGLPL